MNIKDFNYHINVQVRFNEVDMLGVCNNAVFINYFEHARLEYIKHIGLMPEGGIFADGKIFFMVRNEINYRDHARYSDELSVYTKISYIKNSSFGFDHLIVNSKSNKIIVDGKGVVVQVNPKTGNSLPLDDQFYETVKKFEPDVQILK